MPWLRVEASYKSYKLSPPSLFTEDTGCIVKSNMAKIWHNSMGFLFIKIKWQYCLWTVQSMKGLAALPQDTGEPNPLSIHYMSVYK